MSGAYAPPMRPPAPPPRPAAPPVPEQLAFDFTLSPGAATHLPDTSRIPHVPKVAKPPEIRA